MQTISKNNLIFLVAIIISLSACGGGPGGPPKGAAVPVIVATAKQEVVNTDAIVVGSIAANESVEIQSNTNGLVEEIGFSEGQDVTKDTVLFKIDQKTLLATVAEAEANYELAEANLKRSKSLLKSRTISSKEYDQNFSAFQAAKASLERVSKELRDATIVAPFDGRIGARMISVGQLVTKGSPLTTLVSLNPIKVELEVPERFVGSLHSGLTVEIEVDAYPKEAFVGEIFFVSPNVNQETRTVLTKAVVKNMAGKLLPGMLATGKIILDSRENAVTIPETALVLQKDKAIIYVVEEGNKVALREVLLGKRLKGRVEIMSGINAGEVVVVEGLQKIHPGSNITPQNKEQIDDSTRT